MLKTKNTFGTNTMFWILNMIQTTWTKKDLLCLKDLSAEEFKKVNERKLAVYFSSIGEYTSIFGLNSVTIK